MNHIPNRIDIIKKDYFLIVSQNNFSNGQQVVEIITSRLDVKRACMEVPDLIHVILEFKNGYFHKMFSVKKFLAKCK